MKFKHLLLLTIFFLFIQNSFAEKFPVYDSILKENLLYVVLTGNPTYDTVISNAIKTYWKVTPYKFIDYSDKTLKGVKPIFFMVLNENYYNIAIIDLKKVEETRGILYPSPYAIIHNWFMPDRQYTQTLFMIPQGVKLFNDEVTFYKMNKRDQMAKDINTLSPTIKNKILIIPQEMTEKIKWGAEIFNTCLLDERNLAGYRYKYKIIPLSETSKFLTDSAATGNYCYLFYYGGGDEFLHIYDCSTNKCLLELDYTHSTPRGNRLTENNMRLISDIIDGVKKD